MKQRIADGDVRLSDTIRRMRMSGHLRVWPLLAMAAGCGEVKATDADAASGGVADAAAEVDAAVELECPTGMAPVPGGTYVMAQKAGENVIEPFCIDITHVKSAEYAACGSCAAAGTGTECNAGIAGRANDPANCIDATQAEFFCELLGKRLPSEEEFEWAARGGEAANLYAWGNETPMAMDVPERLCWEAGRALPPPPFPTRPTGTCPSGAFNQSVDHPFGVEDMTGNTWEWTTSAGSAANSRVVRGGGFDNDLAARMETGFRNEPIGQTVRHQALGFRCIADPL